MDFEIKRKTLLFIPSYEFYARYNIFKLNYLPINRRSKAIVQAPIYQYLNLAA